MTRYLLLILLSTLLLNACNNTQMTNALDIRSISWVVNYFPPFEPFQNYCALPRKGIDPTTQLSFPDQAGSRLDENNWLRSWSNHFYLWYDEIIDKDPALYETSNYFQQLKSPLSSLGGKEKGRFHYQVDTHDYLSFINKGEGIGYGAEIASLSNSVPRHYLFLYTEPHSPAAKANIQRGSRIIAIDGLDFINTVDALEIEKINAALLPSKVGEVHTFTIQPVGQAEAITITMRSSLITNQPVNRIRVIDTEEGKVGYILFNEHIKTAENQLINTIEQFKKEAIKDLILDLRYNTGGIIYIASQLGYMITGEQVTKKKNFLTYQFNDKHPTIDPFTNKTIQPIPFYALSTDHKPLPSLGLKRVYILTSNQTCSSSELLINALRGIDVDVIQIGGTTCGKPYASNPTSNCGSTYISINMQTNNHKGFGDYPDGFTPSHSADQYAVVLPGCFVEDDLKHPLGDPEEALLAAALAYRKNNQCPLVNHAKGLPVNTLKSLTKPQWKSSMIRLMPSS